MTQFDILLVFSLRIKYDEIKIKIFVLCEQFQWWFLIQLKSTILTFAWCIFGLDVNKFDILLVLRLRIKDNDIQNQNIPVMTTILTISLIQSKIFFNIGLLICSTKNSLKPNNIP